MKYKRCMALVLSVALFLIPTVVAAGQEPDSFLGPESGLEKNNYMDLEQRYEELLGELKEKGFGEQRKLTLPESTGYSLNAVELFKTTFVDLGDTLQLDKAELPQETILNFMQEGYDTRDKVFADIKGTPEYQSVLSKLSVGSIWKKAEQGLPEAKGLLQNAFALDFKKADTEHNKNQDEHAQLLDDNLQLFTESGKTLDQHSQSVFWKMTQQVKELLTSEGNDTIYDLFVK